MGMLDDLAEGAYYATTGSDPKRAKNRDRRAGGGRISSRMTADFSLEGSLEGELDLVQTYNNFGIRNASGRKGQSKGAGTEKARRGRDRSGYPRTPRPDPRKHLRSTFLTSDFLRSGGRNGGRLTDPARRRRHPPRRAPLAPLPVVVTRRAAARRARQRTRARRPDVADGRARARAPPRRP